jgi:hypothetical protein
METRYGITVEGKKGKYDKRDAKTVGQINAQRQCFVYLSIA